MTIDRLPPLNAIRAFEAAARTGSYVAAAQALHVTQPAIGRHVKILEEWLGLRLFNRSPRGVSLTPEGAYYYQSVSESFKILTEAGTVISRRSHERWLRILCVPAFASRWLTPRVEALCSIRPGLKIAIEPNATFTYIDARKADLAIAYGLPGEFSDVHEVLIRPEVFPVCSPGFLAELPEQIVAKDLLKFKLIHVDDGSWWSSWFAALGIHQRVKADASHISNDVVLNLAKEGQGIALATDILVEKELCEGSLVRCVPQSAPLESYQILTPSHPLSEDALWFIKWLGENLRRSYPNAAC